HIYALLVEVAPSEAADHIDKKAETEFEYIADRGMVRVRIVPEMGRLTAVVAPSGNAAAAGAPAPAAQRPSGATAAPPAPAAQRAPAVAGGRAAAPAAGHHPPASLPVDFAASQYQGAERALGELLKALVQSASSDLHLRVGEPAVSRTHGEMKRQNTPPLSSAQLELMLLSVMPDRNRGEWKETGDSDFAYEIRGLARFRVTAARDRKGPTASSGRCGRREARTRTSCWWARCAISRRSRSRSRRPRPVTSCSARCTPPRPRPPWTGSSTSLRRTGRRRSA